MKANPSLVSEKTLPVQSINRAPLFAARTLNATGQYRVTLCAVRELKSRLWATAGGKEPNIRTQKTILAGLPNQDIAFML